MIAATDSLFLETIAEGVSVTASSGDTAANVLADLGTLLAAVPTSAENRLYLVVSPAVAKSLSVKSDTAGARAFNVSPTTGGEIAGIPVLISDHLPTAGSPLSPTIMLIDASGIAADAEVVVIDLATHATIEMADPPTNARWHAEQQIDDLIANEPDPRDRAMLALHRERIIDKLTDLAVIADLRRRLAEAEQARLRLVS